VKLIYWEGFTVGEIAEMLGMSLSAVHRKFTKDLIRLKEMLHERLG